MDVTDHREISFYWVTMRNVFWFLVLFREGESMKAKESMIELRNIIELNNTLCEAYDYLYKSKKFTAEVVDSMEYGISVIANYDFNVIRPEQNQELKAQCGLFLNLFHQIKVSHGLEQLLAAFMDWEVCFQRLIVRGFINEVWKESLENEELLEGILRLLLDCSVRVLDDLVALELISYSKLIGFKRPMEAYQMGIKAFEVFPEVGKYFCNESNDKFHYSYAPSEEHIFDACPSCNGKGIPYYTVHPFFAVNYDKMFSPVKMWMKCSKCGQLYAYNFPKALVEIHPEEEELGDEAYMSPRPMYLSIFCDILKRAKSLSDNGKMLLEVGPGTGELIATALELQFEVEAIEISRRQANRLQKLFNIDIHCMDFMKFETDKKYDVITMGDVVEHVTNPRKAIEKAYSLLNDTGVLWIATPNFKSGYSRIMGYNDPMWREPYHISYFSYDILKKLLEDVGFQVLDYSVSKRYKGSMELFAKKVDKR